MSVVISTDIFCDGEGCSQWEQDATVTGQKTNATTSRQIAKSHGWVFLRGVGDFCPVCARNLNHGDAR